MDLQQEFEQLARKYIHRDGVNELLTWLAETDFYRAPASARYHGAYEGGLVMHSLNVYSQLKKLCGWYGCGASEETIAIVALFHDLCKVGVYKTELRWRKNQQNNWEQYSTYRYEEDFAYGGHGSKSVYLVMSFMALTPDEASAINCHMGAWDSTTYSNPSPVYERNLLAWLLHVADEADAYTVNTTKEEKHE